MAKKKQEDTFSYDNAIVEVEKILQKLQTPESAISMDELLKDVTMATGLLSECEAYLSQTQQKIKEILDKQ